MVNSQFSGTLPSSRREVDWWASSNCPRPQPAVRAIPTTTTVIVEPGRFPTSLGRAALGELHEPSSGPEYTLCNVVPSPLDPSSVGYAITRKW